MSRSVSLTFTQAINSAQTGEAFLILLEIASDEFDSASNPIRVTSDAVATVSNGNTYNPYPFAITLPPDDRDTPPSMELTIDNIDRSILQELRQINNPLSVRVMCVLASDPDTIEVDLPDFRMSQVSYTAQNITGVLGIEMFLDEPFPGDSFMPGNFPGLF